MDPLTVTTYDGMSALPAAYEALFERTGRQTPYLSRDWFVNYEQAVLGGSTGVRIYGVESGGSPQAALVMRGSREGGALRSPLRLEALGNYYTPLFGPVAAEGAAEGAAEQAWLDALADALCRGPQRWDLLDLHPLDPQGPLLRALPGLLRQRGMVVQSYFCFGNWYLEVDGRSYADYFKGLSSSLRKNIPYYTRKLERTPASQVEIVTGGERLEQALLDYEKVYASSWKDPEPYPQFIPGLVRLAARNGWLRFGIARVEGVAAAAQIWFVHGGAASIYKVAYDAAYAKLSVGTVLTAKMMEHVIDVDRVGVVDFLSGDDGYKKDWMSHRRERWGLVAFNPRRPHGAWLALRHVGGQALRRLARTIRPPRADAPAKPAA